MNIPREAMSRGGKMRASRMRSALAQRVVNLTPLEAFRLGYRTGLGSKTRRLKALGLRVKVV